MPLVFSIHFRVQLASTDTAYQMKSSGPLMDRIDLHVEVPWIEYKEIEKHASESSLEIKKGWKGAGSKERV